MAAAEDRAHTGPDASFSVVRHGFDRTQVRRHLRQLDEIAAQADADRDEARAQVAELRGELEIAKREIVALTERLDAVDIGDGEQSAVRLLSVAKSQATEVTSRAEVAAEQTWAGAEQASAALRERYRRMLTELDEQHAELSASHKSIMSVAKAQVEEMTTEAERRRREIDKVAERDRIRIDREFSESMATKREALRRELEADRAASVKEVEDRLHAADEEAKRRVDAVTEQVNRLSAVRDQLAGRLRETQELLDRSAALLEPADGEAALVDERLPTPEPPVDEHGKRTVPPQREAKRDQPASH